MSNLILNDRVGFLPHGFVTLTKTDMVTGENISRLILPVKQPNSATNQAKIAAAHCLGGDSAFAVTRVEWGIGHATNPSLSDTNLEHPLYTTNPNLEGIYTPVTKEYPSASGQIRFISELTSDTVGLASFETPSVDIWEVALRTDPLPLLGYPKGLIIARFVNDSPIQKSGIRTRIGIEWLYIYA